MDKYEKRNSEKDSKTAEMQDEKFELERRRLEKWRPGRRNFP